MNSGNVSLFLLLMLSCLLAHGATAPAGAKENPIRVNGVEMERLYCRFLRTPDGQEVEYKRVGSIEEGRDNQILDWYKVKTKDGKQEWDVYIDMHYPEAKGLPQIAPPGLLTLEQFTMGKLKGRKKKYIGIDLPTGSQFTPLLAEAVDGKMVSARIVPSKEGRDIQVLEGDGTSWEPLTARGQALTQEAKGYAFLGDMRYASDGALWVMATFTFPDRDILYRFDGTNWERKGPVDGVQPTCKSWKMWNAGLLFGKNGKPFCVQNRQIEGLFVAELQDTGWVEAKLPERILSIKPPASADTNDYSHGFGQSNVFLHAEYCEAENSVWLFWDWRGINETRISALRIEGPSDQDFIGPFEIMSLPGNRCLLAQAVSKDGRIALKVSNDLNGEVFVVSSSNNWKTVSTKTTPHFPRSEYFCKLRWSPESELYAVCEAETNCAILLHLGIDKWETAAQQHQPVSEGIISSPEVFFLKGRKPIITWGDSFR